MEYNLGYKIEKLKGITNWSKFKDKIEVVQIIDNIQELVQGQNIKLDKPLKLEKIASIKDLIKATYKIKVEIQEKTYKE